MAASDQVQIAALLRDIMPVFTDVVREFSNDDNLLTALALGQIALNFFVNHFLSQTSEARAPIKRGSMVRNGDDGIIREFKALPQFGCRLKPERCQ